MLTAGIDLAAEDANTAVARIRWTDVTAYVEDALVGANDDLLAKAVSTSDKAGIDCPFGWPGPFVDFIAAHHVGRLATNTALVGREWRKSLAWRRTDYVTHRLTGLVPLSVAADRIAHTAMRCAALLARLADDGHPVDRAGGGTVVEVYPAASLKQWGLPHRGYKGRPNVAVLQELVDRLTAAAPWLVLGQFEALCRRSDHAVDAVVAALTARAAILGRVTGPDPADRTVAATEGWIAIPTTPVDGLLG
jgi:predicted nuclease with RNAse H fold